MGILLFTLVVASIIGIIMGFVKKDKRIKNITLRLLILALILYTFNYVMYSY